MTDADLPSFWGWFLRGLNGPPGIRKLANGWLLLHLSVGIALTYLVPVTLREAANSVLLPLTGIFIGLSFAWGGNAQALLQTDEVDDFTTFHPQGPAHYIFTFQAAIVAILATLGFWGLAGLGILDQRWPVTVTSSPYRIVSIIMYALTSLTVRECWHVVLGAQTLLLLRQKIRRRGRNS